jgi:hypothetical protein
MSCVIGFEHERMNKTAGSCLTSRLIPRIEQTRSMSIILWIFELMVPIYYVMEDYNTQRILLVVNDHFQISNFTHSRFKKYCVPAQGSKDRLLTTGTFFEV